MHLDRAWNSLHGQARQPGNPVRSPFARRLFFAAALAFACVPNGGGQPPASPSEATSSLIGTLRVTQGDALLAPGPGHLTRAMLRRELARAGRRPKSGRIAYEVAGPRRIVALLVNFPNDPRTPFTSDQVRDALFGASNSVRSYYTAMSDGKVQFTGDVFGWFQLPIAAGTVCDPDAWGDLARAAAAAAGVDLTTADHIVYIWPRGRCGGTSLGSQRPVDGFKDPTTVPQVWIDGDISLRAIAHELGHNLGLMHAFGLECRGATGERVAISSDCLGLEYQDPFGVMGGADPVDTREWGFELGSRQRGQLGWQPESRSALVTSSTTVTLDPIEGGGSGLTEVRIPRCAGPGPAQIYSLEYRQPVRFDAGPSEAAPTGVYIRLARVRDQFDPADATSIATYPRVFLVDTTPQTPTFLDSALGVGASFVDASSAVTIRSVAADPTRASVAISFGPDTVPPAPASATFAIVDAAHAPPERLGPARVTSSPRSVVLSWEATTDCGAPAAGYRVLRDGVAIGSTSALTFKDLGAPNLDPGRVVRYSVQSIDRAGNASAPSEDAVVTLPDLTPPTRPTLAASLVAGRVEVRWAASSNRGRVRYSIYRDGVRLGSTASQRFRDTFAAPGASHRYRVVAVDEAGNLSAPSAPVSLTLGRTLRVGHFLLTSPATVNVTIRSGGHVVASFAQQARGGWNQVVIPAGIGRRLHFERYTAVVAPIGNARLRSASRIPIRITTGRTSGILQG